MKCSANIRTCRNCGEKNTENLEKCAHCGGDMKCQNEEVAGYGKCVNHGGPAPSRNFYGIGTLKNGKASRFQVVRLAARYNEMQTNGQLLSNRASVDILDHRIRQLLERVDFDEAPDRLKRLNELWQEFQSARRMAREVEAVQLEKQIDDEFEKVYHDYAAWKQIFEAMDLRGKQVEREVKVLKEIKAIMTAEDGYELVTKLLAATMRVVGDDPRKMKQVQYEFTRIIGESGTNIVEGHGEDVGGDGASDGGEAGSGDVDQEEFLHPGDEE